METSKLRKFASFARSALIEQVGTRLKTVLAEKSLARRESPNAVKELEAKIKDLGEKRLIETVAYTWFNRFCALRYMDVNRYTQIGVLSPAEGQFQPEILAEAKMGHVDEELVPEATRKQVMRLLDGSDKSADPQGEAYRLLLVAVCNYYHALMPFMFEKIADYTELLLPDDLLSGTSIPAYTREALLPINCSPEHTEESVEVIGWLYQFYIADKKDEVFDSLKKGKKITAENIPAATQLFTPHWIVRYLLENSLGRLWMLNHSDSKLIERMDYYIKPEEPEADFLKISSPEEIKVCDPACGSGHMLTYAFDLLYEIYREEQYPEPEIPSLILRNNLYGIEIDRRAGALAAFALTMKAREKDKRFFTRKPHPEASERNSASIENPKTKIQNPNICVLENIKIDREDLSAYMDKVGRGLFTDGLQGVVNQWEEADNFGSLIRPLVNDVTEVLQLLRERQMGQDLFLAKVHEQVLSALRQADFLSPKYHVVVANPPYMGSKGMNNEMKLFAKKQFESGKSDLFAMFILRNLDLCRPHGSIAMITMQSWMFLSSLEELRSTIVSSVTIDSMAHLGTKAFDTIGGEVVSATAFTLNKRSNTGAYGDYFKLTDGNNEAEKKADLLAAISNPTSQLRYKATSTQFLEIPGAPIAYWFSNQVRRVFREYDALATFSKGSTGLQTSDNERFVRFWHEVGSVSDTWVPFAKGGGFRRWYGNVEHVVNWRNHGEEIKAYVADRYPYLNGNYALVVKNESTYFLEGLITSRVTTGKTAFRYKSTVEIFADACTGIFPNDPLRFLGLLSSKVVNLTRQLNPTFNFQASDIERLPVPPSTEFPAVSEIAKQCIAISKEDWDNREMSSDFLRHPCIGMKARSLSSTYEGLRHAWSGSQMRLKSLEEENNRIVLECYGLSEEIDAAVDDGEVSLECNPSYRYGADKSDADLEALLLADTMREFISYAVGCMLGRYSLDKPGLILANQGETADDYRRQVPEPTFAPDEDNVIPILEGEWFTDDVSQRFREFLKVTFGTEHYEENLKFLEDALYPENPTAKKRKTIRDYFLKEFYDHHLKMYKKRPIYWLFSSPKGTFNALIYMHRYRPDTVGTVLHYLRDFRDKLTHHAEHQQMLADSASASKSEKTQAIKDVANIKKQLKELEEYEKSLFEVASRMRNVDLDLDDGVKHNYLLFGSVLRRIPGLDAKED